MFRKKFLSMILLMGMLISQSVPRALAQANCDHVEFVSDLTVPDGSAMAAGTAFTKTWRLKNIGTCTWTTSYNLVWAGGELMDAPLSMKLPVDVPPGQMLDLSVNLKSPTFPANYKAFFQLSNAAGTQFGMGDAANLSFWVDINVVTVNAMIYDFVANAPFAQWKSGAGVLPFPGTSGDSRGFAYQIDQPHLEDDSVDSVPGLLAVPQNKFNGYIQAAYPEFEIQRGDHLQTLVNCEFGATRCYVTFRVDYILPSGVQRTLWSWKEAYDRRFYRADIDLSSLAGQKVRFVFMLLASGSASGDRAIWGSPRIVRMGSTQPPAPPATLTPLPPPPATATPIGQPPPTIVPSGCDKAAFVTDATVPDGTIFSPGAAFTKTWRLRNVGTCAWTTSYKLLYYSGESMSAPTTVNLPWSAAWGQTVDISVNMVAPTTVGKYRGYWILANANGQYFGIGGAATDPVWVEINVAGEAPHEGGYNFWQNACSAQWRSGAGVLPCPGTEGDSKGFVIPLNNSHLEDGTMGPAPSLLISPENKYNGYIQGIFPTFTIQPGDHFVSVVGCEHEYSCHVTFRLDYMTANGGIFNFWSWREKSDQKNYMTNVDLSPLAGRSVRFILTVLATGSSTGDRVRWGAPSIVRGGGAPPPVTITPASPTVTVVPPTLTPIPLPNDWLTYTNSSFGFLFKYPPQGQISEEDFNALRMDLPFVPGTNLREKYLQVSARVVDPCQSPLSATSRPGSPTETVVINGISF
ncbi:MAG TPA: NBR1-Ig-like domain-containing protein, partial [Anaerolineales bacterium]|nr:NBR1-Ig-like domain-containing protein [Anaerolineales bacterium]